MFGARPPNMRGLKVNGDMKKKLDRVNYFKATSLKVLVV